MADLFRILLRTSLCAALLAMITGGDIGTAYAQQVSLNSNSYRIVRVVNDNPITTYDIASRLRFVSATAPTPVGSDEIERFSQQIIENLVDEQLQLQEAERLDIRVEDSEIQAAVARIERQNGLASGQLINLLTSRNVDANTLIDQIRATLAWRKTVELRLQRRVTVTEEDIDFYLDGLRQKGGTEYLLGEIFISAHQPSELPRAKETAERLLAQLRRGSQFSALARQFSQAPTAAAGGDTGWVRPDQLESQLAGALVQLQPGQISPPIEVPDGYYLLALRDSRTFGEEGQEETVYDLRRVFLPYSPTASENAKRRKLIQLANARAGLRSCAAVERYAARAGDPQNGMMGEMRLTDLPEGLRPFVLRLQPGKVSQLLRLQDGALVLMLCEKKTRALGLPDRETVRQSILQREADIHARRYIRELRQNAIIETLEEPA